MSNPYKSPFEQVATKQADPSITSPAIPIAVLFFAGVFSWITLIWALSLAFKDMFGGPGPPHTDFVFLLSGLLGIVAEFAGIVCFVRMHGSGSKRGMLATAIAMGAAGLPLFMIV